MIFPSIAAIENNEYQKAYDIYKTQFAELEQKFLNQEQNLRLIRITPNNQNPIQSRV